MVSAVVAEVMVQGVIGRGDIGTVGESGHLNRGLDMSSVGCCCILGDAMPERGVVGLLNEGLGRTRCFKAETGPLARLNRGEAGVFGLGIGDASGAMMGGS